MSTVEDLEASLQATWSADTLAVYADALIARGDPRGELVALDLQLARGATPELEAAKAQRLRDWLGMTRYAPHRVEFGLLDDLGIQRGAEDVIAQVGAYLTGPLAGLARSISIETDIEMVTAVLQRLATGRHPWLRRLRIRADGPDAPVARDVTDAMFEAAPHLDTLVLDGPTVMDVDHPQLRNLDVRRSDSAAGDAPTAIERLALGLDDIDRDRDVFITLDDVTSRYTRQRFPRLRELDLSRNDHLASPRDAFHLLAALADLDLQRVRLPSIRHESQLEIYRRLSARSRPELTVARSYRRYQRFTGIPLERCLPFAPPGERYDVHPTIVFDLPPSAGLFMAHGKGAGVFRASLTEALEVQFDDMTDEARRAWTTFYLQLERHPDSFPTDVLRVAFESLDVRRSPPECITVRDQLRVLGPSAPRTIRVTIGGWFEPPKVLEPKF